MFCSSPVFGFFVLHHRHRGNFTFVLYIMFQMLFYFILVQCLELAFLFCLPFVVVVCWMGIRSTLSESCSPCRRHGLLPSPSLRLPLHPFLKKNKKYIKLQNPPKKNKKPTLSLSLSLGNLLLYIVDRFYIFFACDFTDNVRRIGMLAFAEIPTMNLSFSNPGIVTCDNFPCAHDP